MIEVNGDLHEATADVCSCEACKSAVSPSAYLADLLDYVVEQLTRTVDGTTEPVSLDYLVETFNQPFDALPIPDSCRAPERVERQVRLCIEVLRHELRRSPPTSEAVQRSLRTAEADYRHAAYEALLEAFGTTRDELRTARTDPEAHGVLAERVGIDQRYLYEESPRLFLARDEITEEALETVFGLANTVPPETGLPSEVTPLLRDWRESSLQEAWAAQDHPDDVFQPDAADQRPIVDPDVIGPDDFRTPDPDSSQAFALWVRRRRWVDERLEALRNAAIDDSVSEGTFDFVALLESMTAPVEYAGETVIPWDIVVPEGGQPVPENSPPPIETFETLRETVVEGSEGVEDAREAINRLSLTTDEFVRVVDLKRKHERHQRDSRNDSLTDDEAEWALSVLTQATKRVLFTSWIDEESTTSVTLDPTIPGESPGLTLDRRIFWPAIRDPSEGRWPPRRSEEEPLIDPETVDRSDLPDPTVGTDAVTLWTDRREILDAKQVALTTAYQSDGFNGLLIEAYGPPPSPREWDDAATWGDPSDWSEYLEARRRQLSNADPAIVEQARSDVQETLGVSQEEFVELLDVRERSDPTSETETLDDAELKRWIILLTSRWKRRELYTTWRDEETETTPGGEQRYPYWTLLKARLPDGRATLDAYYTFRQALEAWSRPPIIDPDLIDENAELARPAPGEPAFELLTDRSDWLETEYRRLSGIGDPTAPRERLDELLIEVIGVSLETVESVAEQRSSGEDVSGRLEQLGLPPRAFRQLVRTRDLIEREASLDESDWESILQLLVQVSKRRLAAAWHRAEREAEITLTPDHFDRVTDPEVFPEDEESPLWWRIDRAVRREWVDTLETRLEQLKAIDETLREAISEVEESTLPMLRDGLVRAYAGLADGDADLTEAADSVIDRFLIDARTDGCTETTRTAQAIETLQGLVFAVRTGQEDLDLPAGAALQIDDPDFDAKWEWIGSYATWKAAMGVYLFPETIIYPTYRKYERQTPLFRRLVEQLDRRSFTRQRACQVAQTYAEYFEDVCTMTVEATCYAPTRTGHVDCDRPRSEYRVRDDGYQDLLYQFGRGERTGTVYWSTFDGSNVSEYAQSFWDAVSGLTDVTAIVGAVPYTPPGGTRGIYLFVARENEEGHQLVLIRYDLERLEWDDEPMTLPLPPGETDEIVVSQMSDATRPPAVAIRQRVHRGFRFYIRELSQTLEEWYAPETERETRTDRESSDDSAHRTDRTATDIESEEWERFEIESLGIRRVVEPYEPRINALVRAGYALRVYHSYGNYLFKSRVEPRVQDVELFDGELLGLLSWVGYQPRGNNDFMYYRELGDDTTYYRPLDRNGVPFGDRFEVEIDRIHSFVPLYGTGDVRGVTRMLFGIEERTLTARGRPHTQIVHYLHSISTRGLFLPHTPVRTHPRFIRDERAPESALLFAITEELSASDRIHRSNIVFQMLNRNEDGPAPLVTYLREAYYFLPMQIALQAQEETQFTLALDWFRTIYDYEASSSVRKVYPNSWAERSLSGGYRRPSDWLLDPLDAHGIAETRPHARDRFTLLALVRCLLDYADAEFTRDTMESLARARTLYRTALEILRVEELQPPADPCDRLRIEIGVDDVTVGPTTIDWSDVFAEEAPTWEERVRLLRENRPVLNDVVAEVNNVEWISERRELIAAFDAILRDTSTPFEERVERMQTVVDERLADDGAGSTTLGDVLETRATPTADAYTVLLSNPEVASAAATAGRTAANAFYPDAESIDSGVIADGGESDPVPENDGVGFRPRVPIEFCIPHNPVWESYRIKAELGLFKLRNCLNIAGMRREVEPYAAPTDIESSLPSVADGQLVLPRTASLRPTPYRYETLIERATELVTIAQQIEAGFLAALEKRDAEEYSLLRAKQDAKLARAGIRLQNLRVNEAETGVTLSELQRERSSLQAQKYQELIDTDLNEWEQKLIGAYEKALQAEIDLLLGEISLQAAQDILEALTADAWTIGGALSGAAASIAIRAGVGTLRQRAVEAQTAIQTTSVYANRESRREEWRVQKALADKDVVIGDQQIRLATNQLRVVEQELAIAELQATHAGDVVEFLELKFTNSELYDWMADIHEGIYAYFLQQATSMAKLAEQQLAFERQLVPPQYIQSDYWQAPHGGLLGGRDGEGDDRRGLTGSARLLEDIYRLDQYAFETDERRQRLTKTLSLAQLAPFEFEQFRQTGVFTFATPMELFDRDHPGHYLRLIDRVTLGVIALVPPTEGVKATLATRGVSRVVTGDEIFQTVEVRRPPEVVAFNSPITDSRAFQLEPEERKLRPFEKMGVDAVWELRMEKASNPLLDYDSIADVVFTVEYTALDSFEHRQRITEELSDTFVANRAFSFRQEFADQWFDLNNPDQTDDPLSVRFTTRREDFPVNVDGLRVKDLLMYFVGSDREEASDGMRNLSVDLTLSPEGDARSIGGEARPSSGRISTQGGTAGGWIQIPSARLSPIGEWTLTLRPDMPEVRSLFSDDSITDVLFVITYAGRTPEWGT